MRWINVEGFFRLKNQIKVKRSEHTLNKTTDPSYYPLIFNKEHFNLKTKFLELFKLLNCKVVPRKVGSPWNATSQSESSISEWAWRSFQSLSFSFGEHVKQQGVTNTENL